MKAAIFLDCRESCQIPARLHVFFLKTKSSQILQANDVIEDGASANMVCLRGFHLSATSYCVPPRDSTPALIYRIQGLKRIDLDRFQTVYPNGTIFQYKNSAAQWGRVIATTVNDSPRILRVQKLAHN
uniref:Peptidase S1 domain-containing protein n=1 Tax=Heterorhabditis bacteriophora TaxID=37862 RepID=A0A1I7X471_HETBA